jgi:hypothetical protein
MANGEVWYALNFFTSPFEYQMVDCSNSGQEPTALYEDKITTLLFETASGGFDSACWFTSCDGTNFFSNCAEDSSSYRVKAERDDNGNIEFFHHDTD